MSDKSTMLVESIYDYGDLIPANWAGGGGIAGTPDGEVISGLYFDLAMAIIKNNQEEDPNNRLLDWVRAPGQYDSTKRENRLFDFKRLRYFMALIQSVDEDAVGDNNPNYHNTETNDNSDTQWESPVDGGKESKFYRVFTEMKHYLSIHSYQDYLFRKNPLAETRKRFKVIAKDIEVSIDWDYAPPVTQGKKYKLFIIEVLEFAWYSMMTITPEYILGKGVISEKRFTLGFLSEKEGKRFSQLFGIPNYYKKGDVPGNYNEDFFKPDLIYPGQRFFIIDPQEDVKMLPALKKVDKGSFIEKQSDKLLKIFGIKKEKEIIENVKKLWMGVVFGASLSWGIGKIQVSGGVVFSISDIFDDQDGVRVSPLAMTEYGWGPGIGASYSPSLVFFSNFDGIDDINDYDSGWSPQLDITLGMKIPRGMQKTCRQFLGTGKELHNQAKFGHGVGSIAKRSKISKRTSEFNQYMIEQSILNLLGNIGQKRQVLIFPISAPVVSGGLNLWLGMKQTRFFTKIPDNFEITYQ